MGIVDTGGGYCSQNVMPVHVGLGSDGQVDIEVTTMSRSGRVVTRVERVAAATGPGRVVVVETP
jgi:hypothetical protein